MSYLGSLFWKSATQQSVAPTSRADDTPADPDGLAPEAESTASARGLLDVCEAIAAELNSANAACQRQGLQAGARAAAMSDEVEGVSTEASRVSEVASLASQQVVAVAAASEELATAAREIAVQVARSSTIAHRAVMTSEQATKAIATLSEAATGISHIASAIAAIASRTSLLALNASIEAARAGDAGRGFSVVATEVKELSQQTAAATRDIATRVLKMQAAMKGGVGAVQEVCEAVREMDGSNASVSGAIEEQQATLSDISGRLQTVSQHTGEVAALIDQVAMRGTSLDRMSRQACEAAVLTNTRVAELQGNVQLTLSRMALLGGRWNTLVSVQTACTLKTEPWSGSAFVLELSPCAALIRVKPATGGAVATWPIGGRAQFRLDGAGTFDGTIGAASDERILIIPSEQEGGEWPAIQPHVARIDAADEIYRDAAIACAARVSRALEDAVTARAITLGMLFDADYKPVPDSNPAQFTTAFTLHADRLIRPSLDAMLSLTSKVVGVFVVDRAGYAATHNTNVSQQQRRDDPAWNAKHCRNRRLFDDRAGFAAGNTTRTVLLQSYERDMGNGERAMIKEADAPIHVCGRHWGAVRLMFTA